MAKKKTKKDKEETNPFVETEARQSDDDTLTIKDVKDFLVQATKKRADYLQIADASWNEIEKRNRFGKLYGGNNITSRRKNTKFPLWWSCLQIRLPIVFARLPIPILKDTQGDDPFGRTACILGERLTRGILKTFDCFDAFESSIKDFLVTNFGWGRVYYKNEVCFEEEKIRIEVIEQPPMPQMDEMGQPVLDETGQPMMDEPLPPIFVTPDGEAVPEDLILTDEFGPYILTGEEIEVKNEEVCFEPGLYCNLYIDPCAIKWNKVTRLAYEYEYSYREFIQKFGRRALDKISSSDVQNHREGQPIIVYEYHDDFLKEVRWFAENSEDFFQPKEIQELNVQDLKEITDESEYQTDNSDLYGLSGFFPSAPPLVINQSTKEFWPIPEYYQVQDIIDDVHSIVNRMILLTRAIRVRFLFDSSVRELQALISETGEGGGLGVPNLEQTLMNNRGNLAALVAYFPVDEMISGLNNMYTAFNQRLQMFYEITGISDLIRGQTSNDVEKTYGERQLEGKFALNRMEIPQRKVQEWIKDNYQLMMEMALNMFSEESLDEYITPQTLDAEDKERYLPALELLKNNKRRRFRVDFETDSTASINEQWKRKQATDLANTLTKALESTAKVAETQPELAATELKVLKHLIGEFSDGKLFIDEIQDSIQQVIDKVSQPQEAEPNIELEKLKMQGQALSADQQFKMMQLQMNTQLEYAKIQEKRNSENIKNQLEQIKMGMENGLAQTELQVMIGKLQEDIAQNWEELSLKKEALLAQIQTDVGKSEMEQFRTILDARVKEKQMTLAEAEQALKAYEVQLYGQESAASLQERWVTEARLQEEHQQNMEATKVDEMVKLTQALKPEAPKPAPVSINVDRSLKL